MSSRGVAYHGWKFGRRQNLERRIGQEWTPYQIDEVSK